MSTKSKIIPTPGQPGLIEIADRVFIDFAKVTCTAPAEKWRNEKEYHGIALHFIGGSTQEFYGSRCDAILDILRGVDTSGDISHEEGADIITDSVCHAAEDLTGSPLLTLSELAHASDVPDDLAAPPMSDAAVQESRSELHRINPGSRNNQMRLFYASAKSAGLSSTARAARLKFAQTYLGLTELSSFDDLSADQIGQLAYAIQRGDVLDGWVLREDSVAASDKPLLTAVA